MRSFLRSDLCVLLCCTILPSVGYGRSTSTRKLNIQARENVMDLSPDYGELTILAAYSFDDGANCTPEGWVSVDRTAQVSEFFDVDDFVGMSMHYQGHVGVDRIFGHSGIGLQ